jgi:hypothetical protein
MLFPILLEGLYGLHFEEFHRLVREKRSCVQQMILHVVTPIFLYNVKKTALGGLSFLEKVFF